MSLHTRLFSCLWLAVATAISLEFYAFWSLNHSLPSYIFKIWIYICHLYVHNALKTCALFCPDTPSLPVICVQAKKGQICVSLSHCLFHSSTYPVHSLSCVHCNWTTCPSNHSTHHCIHNPTSHLGVVFLTFHIHFSIMI